MSWVVEYREMGYVFLWLVTIPFSEGNNPVREIYANADEANRRAQEKNNEFGQYGSYRAVVREVSDDFYGL